MSSGGADDTLLDVFVAIRPDEELLKAFNQTINDTVRDTRTAFSSLQAQSDITAAKMKQMQSLVGQRPPAPPPAPAVEAGETAQNDRYKELRSRIREATDELQILQQTLRFTQADLKELGQSDLAAPFQSAVRTASALSLELRQIRPASAMDEQQFDQAEDSINSVISRIEDLRRTVAEARAGSQIQLTVNLDTEKAIADIQSRIAETEDQIKNERIKISSSLPRIVGSASAEDREKIYELRAEIERAQVVADRFRANLDGTPASLERFEGALNGVRNANKALNAELGSIADDRGKSFNNLANSAYQLGQAFEDAAIGFQLNGISGAIRGASNNISFLLNDLSRVPVVQQRIAELFGTTNKRVADTLPLVTGIGAALAISVIPVTIEWLESLNDIKAEFEDISEIIARSSKDIDLTIELQNTRTQLEEAVFGAEEFRDSLKAALDYSRQIDDSTANLSQKLQAVNTDAVSQGIEKTLESFQKAVESIPEQSGNMLRTMQFMTNQNAIAMNVTGQQFSVFTEQQVNYVKERTLELMNQEESLRNQISSIREIDGLIKKTASGQAVTTEELSRAKDLLRQIGDFAKQLADPSSSPYAALDVEEGFIEKLRTNLRSVTSEFEGFSKASDEISVKQKALQDSLQETVRKFSLLQGIDATGIKIKELEGLVTPEASGLIDIAKQSQKVIEQFIELEERLKGQGASQALIDQVTQLGKRASEDQSRLGLLERQKDLQQQIYEIYQGVTKEIETQTRDLRSQATTIEDLSKTLQQNVLSQYQKEQSRDQEDRALELLRLGERLSQVNAGLQVGGNPSLLQSIANRTPIESQLGAFTGIGGVVDQAVELAKIAALLQKTVDQLGGLKSVQGETRDAIKQQDTKSRAGQ
jgi:hypothetical protein